MFIQLALESALYSMQVQSVQVSQDPKNPQHAGLLLKAIVTLLKGHGQTSAQEHSRGFPLSKWFRQQCRYPSNPRSPTLQCGSNAMVPSESPSLQEGGLDQEPGHNVGVQVGGGPAVLIVPALVHGHRAAHTDGCATVCHAPTARHSGTESAAEGASNQRG